MAVPKVLERFMAQRSSSGDSYSLGDSTRGQYQELELLKGSYRFV